MNFEYKNQIREGLIIYIIYMEGIIIKRVTKNGIVCNMYPFHLYFHDKPLILHFS